MFKPLVNRDLKIELSKGMVIIKKTDDSSVGENLEKPNPSHTAGGHTVVLSLWKAVWLFFQKVNVAIM